MTWSIFSCAYWLCVCVCERELLSRVQLFATPSYVYSFSKKVSTQISLLTFFYIRNLFIFGFVTAHGLSLVVASRGQSLAAVRRLLPAASFTAERGF